MAGQKNIYRIARTLLLALAALLAVGAVGSMFMGSRAVSQAKDRRGRSGANDRRELAADHPRTQ